MIHSPYDSIASIDYAVISPSSTSTKFSGLFGTDISRIIPHEHPLSPYQIIFGQPGDIPIFPDANYHLILQKPSIRPLAAIGFDEIDNGIIVRQIQGRKGKYVNTQLIDKWQVHFLDVTALFAKELGFKHLFVQPANQNPYYHDPVDISTEEKILRHKQSMNIIYNRSAKKIGCNYSSEMNMYQLDLSTLSVMHLEKL